MNSDTENSVASGGTPSGAANGAALLRRALGQLRAWQDKYGKWRCEWLPPAGDVRLAEDIDDYLRRIGKGS